MDHTGTRTLDITRFRARDSEVVADDVVIEEPLEIELHLAGQEPFPLTVTMRTPGDDFALAAGFLYTEGIINTRQQVLGITDVAMNRIAVQLAPDNQLDLKRFQRNFYTHSACGVCGKTSIEALSMLRTAQLDDQHPQVTTGILGTLPMRLQQHQAQFARTGGLHAAALFNTDGELLLLCEDVGRHNAMDKLIGHLLLEDKLPVTSALVLVSGRASFELVQKTLMANIAFMAAIGAPSSLAVDLAVAHRMTLVGFLKEKSFNCYAGEWRLQLRARQHTD